MRFITNFENKGVNFKVYEHSVYEDFYEDYKRIVIYKMQNRINLEVFDQYEYDEHGKKGRILDAVRASRSPETMEKILNDFRDKHGRNIRVERRYR